MPSCAADSWRYRSLNAACTVRAFRSPRRTSASMRVRRAATRATSAATKNALANTRATTAQRGRPSDSEAALGLSLVVTALAQRPVTAERTFGLLRLEILAALVNGAALIVIALGVGLEAYRRFQSPAQVHGALLLIIAGVGLAANALGAAILHRGHDHSLNQRGAYLHIVSDLLGSVGALLAGVIILGTGWVRADPVISVLISLLILGSAWRLVKESTDVLLEAAPAHIALADVHD